MKHTPGPWINHGRIPRPDTPYSSVGAKTLIARVWSQAFRDVEQEAANASLIAAAPDLLEACKTFAEWLRREEAGFVKIGNTRDTPEGEAAWRKWFNENLRICDLAQKQALDAIAKSTGSTT